MLTPHENRIDRYFDTDPIELNIPRQVENYLLSRVAVKEFDDSSLIHLNKELASSLGIQESQFQSADLQVFLTSKSTISKLDTFAMNYGGHQFGHWAGQLGDGRAIMLGGFDTAMGLQYFQLKGSGSTPYSRRGDGYAVLRSSIREHLCSEAMFHLGVPTTRSLAISLTGESVTRDPFYNGNTIEELGATVCRVAPSFLRFGSLELPASRGDHDLLKKILDYIIDTHYSYLLDILPKKQRYLQLFQTIADKTLAMVIHWQRVGFVHGVMNTDNMSLLGLTIDYGPYGWMDDYNPDWTPNTTDNQHKRYKYKSQPEVALWNLWKLANAFYPIVEDSKALEHILDDYRSQYVIKDEVMMRAKLGLVNKQENDMMLISDLRKILPLHPTDMTIFYRELVKIEVGMSISQAFDVVLPSFYEVDDLTTAVKNQWESWLKLYVNRIDRDSAFAKARTETMLNTNPKYVLRNYMAQLAIEDAEKGDYALVIELYEMLRNPYCDQPQYEKWYAQRPEWAMNKAGCSQLSCSS